MKTPALAAAAVAVLSCVAARAADQPTGLMPGDRVAVCGDSITEQHQYSADIEAYLAMCRPTAGVTTEQFGWGGETASGFLEKMPQFMLPFGNNVATTCYGMNDGRYAPMTQDVADSYRKKQTAIVDAMKKAGYRLIVVGTPGAVDTYTFRSSPEKAVMYNKTLAALADIDRDIAGQEGVAFADVHGAMVDAMAKAKAKYGEKFAVAGPDGVHPNADGHLVMAYAYLKALNVTGDIGTVRVDLKTQSATATDGHKVLGCTGGAVQMESTRYPFCFSGDPFQARRDDRDDSVHPLQRRPEPVPPGRDQRRGGQGQGDVRPGQQGVRGGRPGEGRKPGGGLPGQPVQRAVRHDAEKDPAQAGG